MIKIPHLILAASILALGACSFPTGTGAVAVKLTDTPFPGGLVSEANVTISRLEIRESGTDDAAPHRIIFDSVQDFNLFGLRNGVTANLGLADVPAGSYDLVRLYVLSGQIVMKDAKIYNLTVPGGAQSGMKIFIKPFFEVVSGATSELLLDFDVSKSFIALGSADSISGFLFKPVVRAVNSFAVGLIAGGVSDTVAAPLVNAEVWAEQDSIISSTFSEDDGSYALLGLLAGSYTVSATLSGYDTVSTTVDVTAGSQSDANFELTSQGG